MHNIKQKKLRAVLFVCESQHFVNHCLVDYTEQTCMRQKETKGCGWMDDGLVIRTLLEYFLYLTKNYSQFRF
jgi:hypothetical protein